MQDATTIPTAPFGRTAHQSTRTIFGAAALAHATADDAQRALDILFEYGINHIDVAASYGDAELHVGRWMDRYRDRFFLATKTGQRSKNEAWEELHRSLERLRTDHIDLWQLHNLVDAVEWDQALSPGGAIDAAVEAREAGLVRYIGVTGHGTAIAAQHLRSLQRFDFDSVLLPYSYVMMQDSHYAAAFEELLAVCRERNVAVQTIKSIARRPWMGREHVTTTWYEPLQEQREIDLSVHWVLGRPGIFLNTASDVALLPRILDAARRFHSRPSDEQMAALLAQEEMSPLFV
jgi:aryl-alcohol dehydrogenase-like predicted oxidoreductase